ncbi:MAG TPA: universal stress protein [Thermomicrobiales bacterium]|jgi:two-component system sensor histidine kinase KdpD|nr:universal stress protein [Thermomicrobiales bacterium]
MSGGAGVTGRRGELRIYLGAAPGVGKTWAMLNAGQAMRERGVDVVVGLVETHGRAETAAQIGDLEIVPRRRDTYRDITIEEMAVDAILRRAPAVVLVDELAHTNVPGSPRGRRFEDVEVLRQAGIDVVTTLNIQHLESLQDIVRGITGVAVRETVPDRVLDGATDVHLIDLPTEDLLARLEQGRIYGPGRVDEALRSFFRAGNLTALRELALRQTAAEVDERLEGYMRDHGIDAVWPAAERVLVLFDDGVASATVLRQAWRLASALRGELVAVSLIAPDRVPDLHVDRRHGMDRNLRLAGDLGAVVTTIDTTPAPVVDPDVVAVRLAALCRDENATMLVLGHRPAGFRERLRGPALVDRVLGEVQGVGVLLVPLARLE